MKILLLNINSYIFFYEQLVVPFGLASLGSYVEKEGYTIKGIDMNVPAEKTAIRYLNVDHELLTEIVKYSPDMVAMSSYASNMYNILFWARILKKSLPNVFIVVGGNHVSYIAKECLQKCPEIDMAVRFEGEIPFKMICENIAKNHHDYSNIPNIVYRKNGKIVENELISLIKNINSLPPLNREYFRDSMRGEIVNHADVITARGCPFHCTFCDCNHYWKKTYRVKSIKSVIGKLKDLCEKYPNLKTVRFRDESLTISKNRCIKLCDEIVKNRIALKFQAHSRLDGLDEEVIKYLSMAGFERLFIGLESGSQTVLERLRKGIDISKAEEVISLLRRYKVKFRISFMISTRDETLRETMQTVKLIKKLKLKSAEFYIGTSVQIYPGTYECDKFLEQNPNYRWLTTDYDFKGKYFGFKDPLNNLIFPYLRSYGKFKILLVYLMLGPEFVLKKIKNRLFSKLKT